MDPCLEIFVCEQLLILPATLGQGSGSSRVGLEFVKCNIPPPYEPCNSTHGEIPKQTTEKALMKGFKIQIGLDCRHMGQPL